MKCKNNMEAIILKANGWILKLKFKKKLIFETII
jgi:hypothetical protein